MSWPPRWRRQPPPCACRRSRRWTTWPPRSGWCAPPAPAGGSAVPGGAGDGAARAQAGGQTGGGVRALAVAFLARWAEASVTNCGKIAALGGGRALARVAARAALEGPDRELTAQLAAVFGVLARDCSMRRGRTPGRCWARPHARAGAVERSAAQEPPAHGRLGGAAAVRGGRGDRAARLGAGGAHAGRILRLRRARRRPGGAPPGARTCPGRCARRARPSASARARRRRPACAARTRC